MAGDLEKTMDLDAPSPDQDDIDMDLTLDSISNPRQHRFF